MLCTRPSVHYAAATLTATRNESISRAEACMLLMKARELAMTSMRGPFIKRCGPGIWYIRTNMGAVHLYTRGWHV